MTDRYTKAVLTVIAVALAAIAARPALQAPSAAAGALSDAADDARMKGDVSGLSNPRTIDVPRSWGRFVTVSDKYLFFESPDGTIRKQPGVGAGGIQWARK